MTVQSLPVSRLINVQVNLSPQAPQGQTINSGLVVGTSDVINIVERMRTYSSLEGVSADFSNNTEEYLSAVKWFEQRPQPTELRIGRWANADTAAFIVGAPIPTGDQAIGLWQAITDGGFLVFFDGVPRAVNGIDLSAQSTLSGVATVIQAALVAQVTSAMEMDWNNTNFVMSTNGSAGGRGAGETLGFLQSPHAAGSASFSTPSAGATLVLNGTAITFVSGTPTGNQVQIAANATMLPALVTLINNSTDTQLSKFEAFYDSSSPSNVYYIARTAGAGGDALTTTTTGTGITASGATLSKGDAEDLAGMLSMLVDSSGAYLVAGADAETALDAVQVLNENFGQKWYGCVVPSADDADHLEIAAYLEGTTNKHFYGITTQETGVLVASDTTNIAYQLKALGYNKTAVQYSSTSPYAVVSLLARILTTAWNAQNSTITLAYKQEPGIVPETLTENQVNALKSFNANVFTTYNNDTAIIEPIATVASGIPIDTIIGLDWFTIRVMTNLYTLLYLTQTKIPQTDAGNHILATQIEQDCQAGVNNGLFAPGIWLQAGFGAISQGQFLPKGYYVYQPPIRLQTQGDRALRKSVQFQVALCLAGSIERVDVVLNVNQ